MVIMLFSETLIFDSFKNITAFFSCFIKKLWIVIVMNWIILLGYRRVWLFLRSWNVMCSELLFVVFAILVLLIVDYYSTSFAVVLCGLLTYFYIQIFSKGSNRDRFIVSLIIKIWGGFSYIFLLWKYLILAIKNVFFTKKSLKFSQESSYHHCGKAVCLEREIDVIVLNISQYYLHSWYDKVGNNEEFILHLNSIIKDTLVTLCSHVTKINRKRISYAILQIYLHFFIHFIETKKSENTSKGFEVRHFFFFKWFFV